MEEKHNLELKMNNSQTLQQLMAQVGIHSLKDLSEQAQVSEWQLFRLEYGLLAKMPVEILLKLSHTLQVSPQKLLNLFLPEEGYLPETLEKADESAAFQSLKQEYQLLQQQMEQQRDSLWEEFQGSNLEMLESWLVQWPTARAVAAKNPQLPALRFLGLVKPVEQMIQKWGVETIGEVGQEVGYDPQYHQLIEGNVQPTELVRIRYVGYRRGDKLLHRAKVSPVTNPPTSPDGASE